MIVEALTEEQKKSAPPAPARRSIVWPMFKWSPDEKFVGRVTPGQQISIYEVPSMGLLGKKSLKIEGVRDFEWCPLNDKERDELEAEAMGKPKVGKPGPARENIIAFWTPEMQNQPARVTLMSLPSRIPIRSKNLFNVHDVSFGPQFARSTSINSLGIL
jgi:translation initiation factor 3 subunit B